MRAVEMKNVTFGYTENVNVLHGVDFGAEYGEIALLSGMSGEGKSTLLSIICGIIPNSIQGHMSGETYVAGRNVRGMKMSDLSRVVGCVLQNAELQIIQQSVSDEVAFGCENLAMPPEMIERRVSFACKMMEIDPDWRTRTLSGGQKQRLITAATLAMGQKIIILDEPLANLDKKGTHTLMSALGKLARKGYCVIVSEHRLDMALPYVDSVWHISKGRVDKVADKAAYLRSKAGSVKDICTAQPSRDLLFRATDVTKSFRGRDILRGVDMDVRRGERVLALGENGCGKTTFTRILARLLRPDGGSVEQFISPSLGRKRAGREWFRRVGVVYQNPNYQLFMPTVRQEVAFGAESQAYADEIMDMFGITHLAARHPQSLSEGQKRRVSIAAVAATRPEVLILDEPTVGQDYEGLQRIADVLNTLHMKDGNTMITITHDVRCAPALCDRSYIIADGVVAESGGKALAESYFGR